MGQTLHLELRDSTFTAIQRRAEEVGMSPADLVKALLEKHYHSTSTEEKQAARARFERHFGEVYAGYPVGVDNESIDEELARAYADNND